MTKSTGVGRGTNAGAPTKFRPSMLKLVRKLATAGLTEREIAGCLEISLKTLTNWKAAHPKFLRALMPGKRAANQRVEQSLYHRAIGYTHEVTKVVEEVVKDGEPPKPPVIITQEVHYPPSEGAAKLWLTNRDPKRWQDKRATELSTPPGRPLEIGAPEPELIGEYYKRLAAIAAGKRPDTGPDRGVGEDRPEGEESEGG